MSEPQGVWLEAELGLQTEIAADLRVEAAEMHAAEAARCRLSDRRGAARVVLSNATVVEGELTGSLQVDDLLVIRLAAQRLALVPIAVIDEVIGSTPALRDEHVRPRTLTSVLRDCWWAGDRVRLLTRTGRWVTGEIEFVGADHVELATGDARFVTPLCAVFAWELPG